MAIRARGQRCSGQQRSGAGWAAAKPTGQQWVAERGTGRSGGGLASEPKHLDVTLGDGGLALSTYASFWSAAALTYVPSVIELIPTPAIFMLRRLRMKQFYAASPFLPRQPTSRNVSCHNPFQNDIHQRRCKRHPLDFIWSRWLSSAPSSSSSSCSSPLSCILLPIIVNIVHQHMKSKVLP